MARLVPVRCPNCGANVRIDPDRDIATCDYCKTSSYVQTKTRPVPEQARIDNVPVIDVEAFQNSLRPNQALIYGYAAIAFFFVVFAVIVFIVRQVQLSKSALSPTKDAPLVELQDSGETVVESPEDPVPVGTKPKFSAGEVDVSGRLSSEVVKEAVSKHHNRFQLCYERSDIRIRSAYGRVTMRFVIGRDGGVSNAIIASSNMESSKFRLCVQEAFSGMLFPKPAGGVATVLYTLVVDP